MKTVIYTSTLILWLIVLLSCNPQNNTNLVLESSNTSEILPDSFDYYSIIGNADLALNNFSAAVNNFNKALAYNPTDANTFYCRGYCYSAKLKDSLAIIDFTNCLKINSQHKGAYFSRAISYNLINDNNNALNDYNIAIMLDSLFSNAYFNRGVLKIKLNKKNEGLIDIKKSASLFDPLAIEYIKKHNK